MRAITIGLYNIFSYTNFDLGDDEDGINLRELSFILGIAFIYIFSASGIWRINMSNAESNHPFKDIVDGYMRSQSHLWFIPFLQVINLSNWEFDADVSQQIRCINEAAKNNIISSTRAGEKINNLRHEMNTKEAEYYFQFCQDVINLKKAVASGVISKQEAVIKEEDMWSEFIKTRFQDS